MATIAWEGEELETLIGCSSARAVTMPGMRDDGLSITASVGFTAASSTASHVLAPQLKTLAGVPPVVELPTKHTAGVGAVNQH